jgi:hypothetical protein
LQLKGKAEEEEEEEDGGRQLKQPVDWLGVC